MPFFVFVIISFFKLPENYIKVQVTFKRRGPKLKMIQMFRKYLELKVHTLHSSIGQNLHRFRYSTYYTKFQFDLTHAQTVRMFTFFIGSHFVLGQTLNRMLLKGFNKQVYRRSFIFTSSVKIMENYGKLILTS